MAEPVRSNRTVHDATRSMAPAGPATHFARKGTAWSEVGDLDAGRARIRLGGLFRTAWMAALCRGLADEQISIDHAHARIGHDGAWIVELNVLALADAKQPASLDLISLAEREMPIEAQAVRLARYELADSRDQSAQLLLSIEAQDSLGLLGSLLVSLAQLGLFPLEMHIETRAGRALDSLWLGTVDGRAPASTTKAALETYLTQCVKGP